jgi:hypothetical protein
MLKNEREKQFFSTRNAATVNYGQKRQDLLPAEDMSLVIGSLEPYFYSLSLSVQFLGPFY